MFRKARIFAPGPAPIPVVASEVTLVPAAPRAGVAPEEGAVAIGAVA